MTPNMKQMYAVNGLRDGDLVGFSGKGFISDMINVGTFGLPRWGLSHIGIVATRRGVKYIFESTTLNGGKACDILGRPVSGVQAHVLEDVLTRPGKVWKYALKVRPTTLQRTKLVLVLLSELGKPYDYKGAARSGGLALRFIEDCFRRQDLDELFCSELVAHALTEINATHVCNASSQSPNSLVRRLKRDGVCEKRKRIK